MKKLLSAVLCIAMLTLMLTSMIVLNTAADAADSIKDDNSNFDKVHSKSDKWENFAPHIEIGENVFGTQDETLQYLVYNLDGAKNLTMTTYNRDGFIGDPLEVTGTAYALKVYTSPDGTAWTEFTSLSATKGDDFSGWNAWKVTNDDEFPDGTAYVKLERNIENLSWLLFYGKIDIIKSVPSIKDDNSNFDKVHSKSDQWENFAPHIEIGENVFGTKDETLQYLVYNLDGAKNLTMTTYNRDGFIGDPLEVTGTAYALKVYTSPDGTAWTEFTSLSATKGDDFSGWNAWTVTNDDEFPDGTAYVKLERNIENLSWLLFYGKITIAAGEVVEEPVVYFDITVGYEDESGAAVGTAPAPKTVEKGSAVTIAAGAIDGYVCVGYKLDGGALVAGEASYAFTDIAGDHAIVFVYEVYVPDAAEDDINDDNSDYTKVHSKSSKWETADGNPYANKPLLNPHGQLGVNVFGTAGATLDVPEYLVYKLDNVKNLVMTTYSYYLGSSEFIGDAAEGTGTNSGNPLEVNSGYGTYGLKVYTSADGTNWTEFTDLTATKGIKHVAPSNPDEGWTDWTISTNTDFPDETGYVKLEKLVDGGWTMFYGDINLTKGEAVIEEKVYHDITVKYVDKDGKELAESTISKVLDNGGAVVAAKTIDGYTAKSYKVNNGEAKDGAEYTFANVTEAQTITFVYEVFVPQVVEKTIEDDCFDFSKVFSKTGGWEVRADNIGNPFGGAGIEVQYHPELKRMLFARKSGNAGTVESLTYNLEGLRQFNLKAFIAYDLEKKEDMVQPETEIEDNGVFGIKVWVSPDNVNWTQVTYTAKKGASIAKDTTNFNPITGEPMPKYEWFEWDISAGVAEGMNYIRFDNGYPVGWVQFFGPISISNVASTAPITPPTGVENAVAPVLAILCASGVAMIAGRKRSKKEEI